MRWQFSEVLSGRSIASESWKIEVVTVSFYSLAGMFRERDRASAIKLIIGFGSIQLMNKSLLGCSLAVFALVLLVPLALADIGTGVLEVYTDTWGGTLAPKESSGNEPFLVNIGGTYYIRVTGITEFLSGVVDVKVTWTDTDGNPHADLYDDVPLVSDGATTHFDITWTVDASAKYCTTGTVHYRAGDGSPPEYVAQGRLADGSLSQTGHFHIVPEVAFGALASSVVFLSALALFAVRKKRRLQ